MSDWRDKLSDPPKPHSLVEMMQLVLEMAAEDAAALEETPPNTSARSDFRDRTGYDLYEIAGQILEAASVLTVCDVDHEQRCCRVHGTHVTPHRGCILR